MTVTKNISLNASWMSERLDAENSTSFASKAGDQKKIAGCLVEKLLTCRLSMTGKFLRRGSKFFRGGKGVSSAYYSTVTVTDITSDDHR
jgi:hypothetical protein